MGWVPRKRAKALFLGSAIDRALKAYYHIGSRQWGLEEHGDPIDRPIPTIEEREVASWEAFEEYFEQGKAAGIEDDVAESMEELEKLARQMWLTYVSEAEPLDKGMEIVCVDWRFTGNVGYHRDDTGDVQILYGGEFDGIVLYGGKLYVLENKTSANVRQLIDSLDRDEQAGRYHWAVARMVAAGAFAHLGIEADTEVWGTLFNILSKKNVTPVRVNQNGTISKQALNNKLSEYLTALTEHRGIKFAAPGRNPPRGSKKLPSVSVPFTPDLAPVAEPDQSGMANLNPFVPTKGTKKEEREALAEEWESQHIPALLRLREVKWNERVLTDRNQAALQIIGTQLFWEGVEEWELRNHPERGFRNPTFLCAIDCPVIDACTAQLRGQPIQSLLEEFYVNRFAEEGTEAVNWEPEDVPELVSDDVGW